MLGSTGRNRGRKSPQRINPFSTRRCVICPAHLTNTLLQLSQVRNQIPYMEQFDEDWATSKIVSQYAGHLRAEARSNSELPADPRYDYLKANSAKRRKDAPRGVRPGLAKRQGQVDANNSEGRDPGPSRAGPSLPNINNAADEDMMDAPGLFGPTKPSDDEDEPDVDNDPDSEG